MVSDSPQQRMSGEERRRQLIEVAIDLFSRRGFGGTTTREIAAAAGVTEAIIFRHFATKQDFYKAILDYKCAFADAQSWIGEVGALMDANDDERVFRFLITKVIAFQRDEPQFSRLLLHASLEGHELAIMHRDQLKLPIGMKLQEYIVRRQAAGAIRPGEPSLILFSIIGPAQFYAQQRYMNPCGELPWTDEQVIEGLIPILMKGVCVKPAKGKSK